MNADGDLEGKAIDVTDADRADARRYSYEVWWSDEDDAWLGRVEEMPGAMNHGETPESALAATVDSAALALAARREWNMPIPVPLDARQPVTVRDLSFEQPATPTARQVRAIRERLGYSQAVFASALGVDLGTVRNWEQGKRQVSGAARRLLQAIDAQPRLLSFWVASNKNGQS